MDSPAASIPDRARRAESANLDLLRACAVLSVFVAHLMDISTSSRSDWTWHLGQLGVLMFFVHTTLVLMYSLERLPYSGTRLASAFYVRRAFRIYPLAIVCVLLAFVFRADPEAAGAHDWLWRDLAANLTLTQNFFRRPSMVGGLWTLPIEVQMYVVLPLLFVGFRRRGPWGVLPLWAAACGLGLALEAYDRLNVLQFAGCFIPGVLAWRLAARSASRKLPAWAWPLGLALVSCVWFAGTRAHQLPFRWLFCLLLGASIPFYAELTTRRVVKTAHLIAKYSYGIYLSHMAIMDIAFRSMAGMRAWQQWSAFAVLAVVCPVLMFHLVEDPMIRRGGQLAKRLFPVQPPRQPIVPALKTTSVARV